MDKAPDAYRTISEVGEDLDIAQHVLRFWETRFPQIKPLKRGGGRRYYRPDDVELLKGIRHLLYREGYTIKGVQRILKEQGVKSVQAVGRVGALVPGLGPAVADDFEPMPAPASELRPVPVIATPPVEPPFPLAHQPLQAVTSAQDPLAFTETSSDQQVTFLRGGTVFRPVDENEPATPPAVMPPNETHRALLREALGELEAVRASIGRVLAGRDRVSGK